MKLRETLLGPGGIKIELDSREIYPDDPGNGTPAMVVLRNGGCATYWCAQGEGEVIKGNDVIELSHAQKEWLNSDSVDSAVTNCLNLRSTAIERDGRDAVLACLK